MFLGIMYLGKGSFHSVRTSVRINEANKVFLGHIHLKKNVPAILVSIS